MPNYICHNPKCPDFEKEVLESRITISYTDKMEKIDSGVPCPKCKADREFIPAKGLTTQMHGGMNVCKH